MSRKKNKELDRLDDRIRALGRSQSDYQPWIFLDKIAPGKYLFTDSQEPVTVPLSELEKTNRLIIFEKES